MFSKKFFFLVECSAELIGICIPPLLLFCLFLFLPLWLMVEKYIARLADYSRISGNVVCADE